MKDINWEKVYIYISPDKSGFIEEETTDSLITLDFTWYIESCIDYWFLVVVDFDQIYIFDKESGNSYSVPSTEVQEILTERIEYEVNESSEWLGLDNYHEDKYLDFD